MVKLEDLKIGDKLRLSGDLTHSSITLGGGESKRREKGKLCEVITISKTHNDRVRIKINKSSRWWILLSDLYPISKVKKPKPTTFNPENLMEL